MLATIPSATLLGVDGCPVAVEVHIGNGLPAFAVVGMPDTACREARDRVKAYASTYPNLGDPRVYAEHALACKAQGYLAYKIHPHAVPRDDIKIAQAVRKAVGDDMVLMLDSMWSYCYEDAVRVGRAIETKRRMRDAELRAIPGQ